MLIDHAQLDDSRCPVVVDSMHDTANRLYGAFYERLYIVLDGVVVYEGGYGPEYYNMDEVEVWLNRYSGRISS